MRDSLELALGFSAQGWCHPSTEKIPMDPILAGGIAQVVIQPLLDTIEAAWGIIASSNHGDWSGETAEWQEAAARWRDNWHQILDGRLPNTHLAVSEKKKEGNDVP